MAPVERTKWMASTWDCSYPRPRLYVRWASPLVTNSVAAMDCSGVRVFTASLWNLSGQYHYTMACYSQLRAAFGTVSV